MKRTIGLGLCLLMLCGCGLLGNKRVPKAQVNTDLGESTINAKDPDDIEQQWHFKDVSGLEPLVGILGLLVLSSTKLK